MGCWSSSKGKKSKRRAAGVPARAKNQKDGRREIPEPEKSKSWASGNSGARKIKKLGVGKFRRPKKSKRWASGNSAGQKNQKDGRREIPQGQTELKRGVGKFRKIEKFYLRIDFLSWRQNVNRLTLQTKKIKTKFHD